MKQILINMALILSIIILPSFVTLHAAPESTTMREIITSATYGVLAGTLVGAASLAFTEQPGDNLQRVARGASLGLYAGLALGFYVVYVVPNQEEEILDDSLPPNEEDYIKNNLKVFPLITQRGVEGIYTHWNVLNF